MKKLILPLLCVFALSGCLTTTMQTKATMSKSVFIDPVAKSEQTIFIAMRNTSGQNINLQPKIIALLQSKGYTIVDDTQKANFILQANVLYCDIKQENNAVGAGVVGGMAGVGVGAYNHNSATGAGGGGLAGAALWALGGEFGEEKGFFKESDFLI